MSPSTAVGLGHTEGLACSAVTPQGCGWVEASAPVPADTTHGYQRDGGQGAWQRGTAQRSAAAWVEAGAPAPADTIRNAGGRGRRASTRRHHTRYEGVVLRRFDAATFKGRAV